MELLQVPGLAVALVQRIPQPLGLDALTDHHDHQVVVQVAHLSGDAGFIAGFGGDEHEAARLAHLFQDLIQPLPEQVGGIRVLILTVLPFSDDIEQGVHGLALLLAAGVHLRQDGVQGHILVAQQDGGVVEHVAQLTQGLRGVLVLGGDDRLKTLLAALFQNLIQPFPIQVVGVGFLPAVVDLAIHHHLVLLLQGVLDLGFRPDAVEKAAPAASVAGGPHRVAEVEQGVRVTVGDHLLHIEKMTAGLPFVPQLLTTPAPEPGGVGL